MYDWYSTVTQTPAPNLLNPDNASFAIDVGEVAGRRTAGDALGFVSSAVALAIVGLASLSPAACSGRAISSSAC